MTEVYTSYMFQVPAVPQPQAASPAPTSVPTQVAARMLLPPGTAAGTWTALLLTVAGTAAYAFARPRR